MIDLLLIPIIICPIFVIKWWVDDYQSEWKINKDTMLFRKVCGKVSVFGGVIIWLYHISPPICLFLFAFLS